MFCYFVPFLTRNEKKKNQAVSQYRLDLEILVEVSIESCLSRKVSVSERAPIIPGDRTVPSFISRALRR